MQKGSVVKSRRKNGNQVWEFRWRDRTSSKPIYRRIVLGTAQELPDEPAARAAVAGIVMEINHGDLRIKPETLTMRQLAQHYRQRELNPDSTWRTYSTRIAYEGYLNRWIIPKWQDFRLDQIRAIEVEMWLRQLPLAPASCSKIRNLMSVLFNHARRYDLFRGNPIQVVRQLGKRRRIPEILTIEEIQRLLAAAKPLYRILIFTDVSTGLRQSELFGLKWADIDFENGQINVIRSVVHGVTNPCKTESSMKPIPMEVSLATVLKEWKNQTPYTSPENWVFASRWSRGKRPMWGQTVMRKGIRPAAQKLGIHKKIGWHTFRHSYSTLLRSLGVDIKVQQDLLRHSSARLTLDTYTQALTPAKREAQNAVLRLLTANAQSA